MSRMRARIFVHRIPIEAPVRTSFGTMLDRPSVLLRIEDGEGAFGWGEVWCNYPSVGAEHRARLLASTVLPLAAEAGNMNKPEALWSTLTSRLRVLAIQTGELGPIAQCLAGLECALQDLRARRAGEPLWRFLVPEATPSVAVYASGINPSGAVEAAGRAIAAGYAGCKLKVGFDPQLDRRNLFEARKILGDAPLLMVDANQAWCLDDALAFARDAEATKLTWLEEPIAHDEPDENWRRLAEQAQIPLAAGENFGFAGDFEQLPARRGLSVLQPDLGKWGGVGQSMRIAARARAEGLQFCPHWLGGGVGLLTSLHVKAASGAKDGLVEVDFNSNPMRSVVTESVFRTLHAGRVQLPSEPGIGDCDSAIADFSKQLVWENQVELETALPA